MKRRTRVDFGMPFLVFTWGSHRINLLIDDKMTYNQGLKAELYIKKVKRLNVN